MATMTTQQFQEFTQEMKRTLSKYLAEQDTITYEKSHKLSFHDRIIKSYTIDSVQSIEGDTSFSLYIYVNQNKNVFSRLLKKIENEKQIECGFIKYCVYDVNVKKYFGALHFHIDKL